jgi:hypothetical protein
VLIKETEREQKKRFGCGLCLDVLKQMVGVQPRRFMVTTDSRYSLVRASEVMITNGGLIGVEPRAGTRIFLSTMGKIHVVIIRAQ